MDIRGHAALVTGGGSGLGAATARMLAAGRRQGGRARRQPEDRRRDVAIDIGGIAIHCDVSRQRQHRGGDRQGRRRPRPGAHPHQLRRHRHGASASSARTGRCRLPTSTAWSRVNLIGTFNAMRLAAAAMQQARAADDGERGVIVVHRLGRGLSTARSARPPTPRRRAASSALMLPLAREFAQFGIRVNAIAPGIFLTPMLQGLPEPAQEASRLRCPFPKRLGDPAQFAALARHMSRTATSTARSSGSTARCAWRRNNLDPSPCRRGVPGSCARIGALAPPPDPLPTLPHKGRGNRSRHADQHPTHAHRMVPLRSRSGSSSIRAISRCSTSRRRF